VNGRWLSGKLGNGVLLHQLPLSDKEDFGLVPIIGTQTLVATIIFFSQEYVTSELYKVIKWMKSILLDLIVFR
jgi:hypothetical protein